jgi:DNA adenine methylase
MLSIVGSSLSVAHSAKPILKWAGGKGQLLEQIAKYIPRELKEGRINSYFEPFVGGGAMFLWVAQNFKIKNLYISDINPELILLYTTVQQEVEKLIEELLSISQNYHCLDESQRKAYFLAKREAYNESKNKIDFKEFNPNWIARSAEMIFLNKTCFNGLFRVNKKGDFNVPFGDYKNPKIFDINNLNSVSLILEKTSIYCFDFWEIEPYLPGSSFIYFDPPYRPLNQTSSFKSYSQFDFSDDEQKRLSEFFLYLHKKGHKLMLSNSDPKNINKDDSFFDDLYRDFNIHRITANRMINSKGDKRGAISEILVTNY